MSKQRSVSSRRQHRRSAKNLKTKLSFFGASRLATIVGSLGPPTSACARVSATEEDNMIRASRNYSRRRFLQSGTAGVTATIMAASTGQGPAQAGVPSPPPASTAPRILRKPPLDELQRIAGSYGLDLNREDLASFRGLMDGVLESYRRLDQFAEPTLPVKYPREPGWRPTAAENELNAWYWKCSIKGAPSGSLTGKKVAIKDNVCVASVPMMN